MQHKACGQHIYSGETGETGKSGVNEVSVIGRGRGGRYGRGRETQASCGRGHETGDVGEVGDRQHGRGGRHGNARRDESESQWANEADHTVTQGQNVGVTEVAMDMGDTGEVGEMGKMGEANETDEAGEVRDERETSETSETSEVRGAREMGDAGKVVTDEVGKTGEADEAGEVRDGGDTSEKSQTSEVQGAREMGDARDVGDTGRTDEGDETGQTGDRDEHGRGARERKEREGYREGLGGVGVARTGGGLSGPRRTVLAVPSARVHATRVGSHASAAASVSSESDSVLTAIIPILPVLPILPSFPPGATSWRTTRTRPSPAASSMSCPGPFVLPLCTVSPRAWSWQGWTVACNSSGSFAIKHAVHTASSLATSRGVPLRLEHLAGTLDTMEEFAAEFVGPGPTSRPPTPQTGYRTRAHGLSAHTALARLPWRRTTSSSATSPAHFARVRVVRLSLLTPASTSASSTSELPTSPAHIRVVPVPVLPCR
ncbi:uncharacterized protein BXZ73DRAFT_81974 [Epithele typhae]|uniref:uncharacterized protein n=1 Tax=Epithele typhae TaxID=378194 RepID=UPI002007F523|nr:uncharacterized protein BXZ73DRAFT_81974 [Epithele typhae]KAH9913348.1 hypothetical protein BXZ73DRAFT_81974 [Epithele typhae]